MKKLVIISLAVLGLGVASCSKQEIAPNTDNELEVPVWQDNARGTGDTTFDPNTGGGVTGGEITDPEGEEDETGGNKKKKGGA